MSQNQDPEPSRYHLPVLAEEVVELLRPVMPGVVVDATFGGGGHSKRILEAFGDDVKVVGIDRDPSAVKNAAILGVEVVESNFAEVEKVVASHLDAPPVGVFFDFGVSSHQLDTPDRGFSYRNDGPLDMRMGPDAEFSAAEIVNDWPIEDLARIIRRYGEEPLGSRIAIAIVAARPLSTTTQLASVIADALPAARRRAGHPARRTFQAIRIAANAELDAISEGLAGALASVTTGGRVIAISYHSLEDRLVKRRFVEETRGCTCPPELPVCGCGNVAGFRLLTRKPIRASDAEVSENKRARSAVLRAVERVAA
jgi:16S rRNA (cytosine1402-N4)-methyltransferase